MTTEIKPDKEVLNAVIYLSRKPDITVEDFEMQIRERVGPLAEIQDLRVSKADWTQAVEIE